jgi:hypothetical protein
MSGSEAAHALEVLATNGRVRLRAWRYETQRQMRWANAMLKELSPQVLMNR